MTEPLTPKRTPRIPPGNRGVVIVLSPFIVAYGVYVMITGRIGKGPAPIEGPLAMILGGIFAIFGVTVFAIAWSERGMRSS